MSELIQTEAANIVAPLLNTSARRRIGAIAITSTSTVFDLSTYITTITAGHYLSFIADGADVYVAFNDANSGTVDNTVTTAGAVTVCYLLKDGVEKNFRLIGDHKYLVAKTASGTATLRVAVSSLSPTQSAADI